jgi:hypothetical protein
MEVQLLQKLQLISDTLQKEKRNWRKIYLYQRFFYYGTELRHLFEDKILPFINCKYPNVDRDLIDLTTALFQWYDSPQHDENICNVERAILHWFTVVGELNQTYTKEYLVLRKDFMYKLLRNKVDDKKNPIYELLLFTTIAWCNALEDEEMSYDVGQTLSMVRGYCNLLRFKKKKDTVEPKVDDMPVCEQWDELVHYILSLLDLQVVMGRDHAVTLYESLDWAGKFSIHSAREMIADPSPWLTKKFGLKEPIVMSFDFKQWLDANHESLDLLMVPSKHKYTNNGLITLKKQKECHTLMCAVTLAVWIIRRLSHWVVVYHTRK